MRTGASRARNVPMFGARLVTSFIARRRLARDWPELGRVLVTDRATVGGELARRDAVRAALPHPAAEISVLIPSKRPRMIDNIIANVARQALQPREVVLIVDESTHTESDVAELTVGIGAVRTTAIFTTPTASLGSRLNEAVDAASSRWLARMDDDDWYGPDYLGDSVRAATVSRASMVGKATYPVVWSADQRARLRFPGLDFQFVSAVAGGTMLWDRSRGDVRFPDVSIGEDVGALQRILRRGGTVFSSDRFQFVLQRQQDATWNDDERRLEASGPALAIDDAYRDRIEPL